MHDFTYLTPPTLGEAAAMLANHGDEARLIAGGTALLLALRQRMLVPGYLIDLSRTAGNNEIQYDGKAGLRIGALARHIDVARNPLVQKNYPMVAWMAQNLANPQVRNRGTIGGNLCYGDPSTDPPTCLLSLDAQVVIVGTQGERIIPLAEFLVDYFQTALEPDEVVKEIRIPPLPDNAVGLYSRFLRTAAEHRPLVGISILAHRHRGVCERIRISIGASVPVPIRAAAAEDFLQGKTITSELLAEASDIAVENVQFISDSRGLEDYRRDMVRVNLRRALEKLFEVEVSYA